MVITAHDWISLTWRSLFVNLTSQSLRGAIIKKWKNLGKIPLWGGGLNFFSIKAQFQFGNYEIPGGCLNFSKMSEFQLFDSVVCNITFIRNV